MKRQIELRAESLEVRQLLTVDPTSASDLFQSAEMTTETTAEENGVSLLATNTSETNGIPSIEGERAEYTDDSDAVLEWNNLFNELLLADEVNQNPGYASRSMAMFNLAIYDAVTIATGSFDDTFYEYGEEVLRNTSRVSAELAASEAAFTVLSALYPDQQDLIGDFRDSMLTSYSRHTDIEASLSVGTMIGNQILEARSDDGSDAVVEYTFTEGVGYFQADPLNPDVPVWGPGWGEVDTFAISSTESFVPDTTPALSSEEYAASYNEVLELGSVDSTVRTADQTEAGIFWAYDRVGLGTPLSLFNDVLETIAVQQGNTLEENAALFAQASVAMADAAIVAWDTKFTEEFWRPVTAIHDGDIDGNEATVGDSDWIALGAPDGGDDIIGFTPQFPTYISGHATFGGALFGTLQEFYGTDDISFELTSQELVILLDDPELQEAYGLDLDDATRSFDSFSEAMAENGRSRVYLGIHFDFDDLVGQEVGQAVAATVSSEFAVPSDDNNGGNDHRDRERDRGPRDGDRGPQGRNQDRDAEGRGKDGRPRRGDAASEIRFKPAEQPTTNDVMVAVDNTPGEVNRARTSQSPKRSAGNEGPNVQVPGPQRNAEHAAGDLGNGEESGSKALLESVPFIDTDVNSQDAVVTIQESDVPEVVEDVAGLSSSAESEQGLRGEHNHGERNLEQNDRPEPPSNPIGPENPTDALDGIFFELGKSEQGILRDLNEFERQNRGRRRG